MKKIKMFVALCSAFVLALAAGQHDMSGVDDDYVVAVIDMRSVGRKMLAAQTHRHNGGETADDEPGGVDHNPLLFDIGGLERDGLHRGTPSVA